MDMVQSEVVYCFQEVAGLCSHTDEGGTEVYLTWKWSSSKVYLEGVIIVETFLPSCFGFIELSICFIRKDEGCYNT